MISRLDLRPVFSKSWPKITSEKRVKQSVTVWHENNSVLNQFKTQYFRSHDNPQPVTLSNHDFRSLMNCLSYFSSELKKKIRCLMWQTCWLNPILTFAETMLHLSLKPTKCDAWLECFAYSFVRFSSKVRFFKLSSSCEHVIKYGSS